ncbi:MAG: MHYT domain-containing protein [Xanthobacteraceae bacterium]|uniref:MHYT domain-containing protein n=1 Tax=Pseudolabrys sp. TaxID=1960880 RepID=UPI003D0BCB61
MFRVLSCLGTEHDLRLVVVAGLVCLLASFAAVSLLARSLSLHGRTRGFWVAVAGLATGCGIWATHFIGMLAYDPGVPIAYGASLTIVSFIVAVAATCAGFTIIAYLQGRWVGLVAGAVVGAGISCMHFLGMWAIELPGRVTWASDLVTAAIVLGVVFSALSLSVIARRHDVRGVLLSAVLLTVAIITMHFTAMGSVTILADPMRGQIAEALSPHMLALAVASAAVAILATSLVAVFAGHLLDDKSLLLGTAMNNMSQGVVMFDAAERLVICNDRYIEMYRLPRDKVRPGCTLRQVIQCRFDAGLLDRDPDAYHADLLRAMATGETLSDVVEYRDGRVISIVNKPINDGQFWVGTHDDITQRRQAERTTMSLAEQQERRAVVDAAIRSFRESMETVLRSVTDSAKLMHDTASDLASSFDETTERASGAALASSNASSGVATAAQAADEMARSIMEIDRRLREATHVVTDAVADADKTNQEIMSLADSASKIGDVIKLIQNIAAQTNLLALNATIEAARAGAAGRGFSVVAAEVKSLSVQTAKATNDIAGQIGSVQDSVRSAVAAIGRIASRMQEIDKHTSSIAASVGQQNDATSEISSSVASAAEGAKSAASILDQVRQSVGKVSGAANTVFATSRNVEDAAAHLREKVDEFLQKVAV